MLRGMRGGGLKRRRDTEEAPTSAPLPDDAEAVKMCFKLIAPSWVRDPEIVVGFQREAAALAAVRSPHVVQVYAFGPHARSWFFAMEHVDGRNLEAILQEHRAHGATVPLRRAVTILAQIGEGIDEVVQVLQVPLQRSVDNTLNCAVDVGP